ncbi:MAG: glycosyl transferase, group 1 family protein [Phenylobacterium sp.]|jgi:D-inositol-3-phosphate glycosyltransferase|nr:glycosyl transferase, group 1 family protein [Phenylobacterium sp.]
MGGAVAARFSIFHPPARVGLGANPFGKDIANSELFQALARHGGFEQLDVFSVRAATEAQLREDLLDDPAASIRLVPSSILNQAAAAEAGVLLRGQPDLYNLAWLRRRTVGDRAYSLMGLAHTIAPPAMREIIAMASVGPVHPWDAVICTSPAVRDALAQMFDNWGDYLGERTGGTAPPRPVLPVVPLGVDAAQFAGQADRPQARAKLRAQLGLAEADLLVLWVGRLSFFEKAFPQAMFQAVQRAAQASGVAVHFALAGWFPVEEDRGRYAEAAQTHAPDVPVHVLDGNDRELRGELWAGADVFLSLVDNIQETFGITPIEAMAAGLPVVASDWDGYRSTIRDGVEGFLIPTLGGPRSGYGASLVQRHIFEAATYQSYVGEVAQYTAVHVGRAAQALTELARSPELRRRMGAAGRERVRTAFDWPVVARQYNELADELALVRKAAADPVTRHKTDPVRGDPFVDFAGFASHVLSLDAPLAAAAGATGEDVRGLTGALDLAFPGLRATPEECAQALDLLASGQARTGREVLLAFPISRRRMVEMGLAWMAKLGLVDWLS